MGGNCVAYKELLKHRFKILTLLTRKKTKSKKPNIPNEHTLGVKMWLLVKRQYITQCWAHVFPGKWTSEKASLQPSPGSRRWQAWSPLGFIIFMGNNPKNSQSINSMAGFSKKPQDFKLLFKRWLLTHAAPYFPRK